MHNISLLELANRLRSCNMHKSASVEEFLAANPELANASPDLVKDLKKLEIAGNELRSGKHVAKLDTSMLDNLKTQPTVKVEEPKLVSNTGILDNLKRRMGGSEAVSGLMGSRLLGTGGFMLGAGLGGYHGGIAAYKLTDRDRKLLDAIDNKKTNLIYRKNNRYINTILNSAIAGMLGASAGASIGGAGGSVVHDLVSNDFANDMINAADDFSVRKPMIAGGAAGSLAGAIGMPLYARNADQRKIQKAMKRNKLRTLLKAIGK